MRVLNGVDEVRAAVGQQLGYSDYQVVDQHDVDAFAALTSGSMSTSSGPPAGRSAARSRTGCSPCPSAPGWPVRSSGSTG
jgi:hypothetical protein